MLPYHEILPERFSHFIQLRLAKVGELCWRTSILTNELYGRVFCVLFMCMTPLGNSQLERIHEEVAVWTVLLFLWIAWIKRHIVQVVSQCRCFPGLWVNFRMLLLVGTAIAKGNVLEIIGGSRLDGLIVTVLYPIRISDLSIVPDALPHLKGIVLGSGNRLYPLEDNLGLLVLVRVHFNIVGEHKGETPTRRTITNFTV